MAVCGWRGNPPLPRGRQNRGIPGAALLSVVGAALLARGGPQWQRRATFRSSSLCCPDSSVCALLPRSKPLLPSDLWQRARERAAIRLITNATDPGPRGTAPPGPGTRRSHRQLRRSSALYRAPSQLVVDCSCRSCRACRCRCCSSLSHTSACSGGERYSFLTKGAKRHFKGRGWRYFAASTDFHSPLLFPSRICAAALSWCTWKNARHRLFPINYSARKASVGFTLEARYPGISADASPAKQRIRIASAITAGSEDFTS